MLNQARRVLFGVVTAALVVAAIGAVFYAGRQSATTEETVKTLPPDQATDYQILNQVRQLLDRNYVKQKDLDSEALFDAALNGMLGSLNDKGTYYVTPDEFKNDTPISGFFDGIGATVSQQKDEVIIVAAIKGTPAKRQACARVTRSHPSTANRPRAGRRRRSSARSRPARHYRLGWHPPQRRRRRGLQACTRARAGR